MKFHLPGLIYPLGFCFKLNWELSLTIVLYVIITLKFIYQHIILSFVMEKMLEHQVLTVSFAALKWKPTMMTFWRRLEHQINTISTKSYIFIYGWAEITP